MSLFWPSAEIKPNDLVPNSVRVKYTSCVTIIIQKIMCSADGDWQTFEKIALALFWTGFCLEKTESSEFMDFVVELPNYLAAI